MSHSQPMAGVRVRICVWVECEMWKKDINVCPDMTMHHGQRGNAIRIAEYSGGRIHKSICLLRVYSTCSALTVIITMAGGSAAVTSASASGQQNQNQGEIHPT